MELKRVNTTFHMDFSIADRFGIKAIRSTFKSAFRDWKSDIRYLTELVIVFNNKCWEHFYKGNEEISRLYGEYYHKLNNYVYENFEGEDIEFYFRITD